MSINTKDIFRLPVLITKGLVLFPGFSETISAEREISRLAAEEAISNNDTYCILVSQVKLENDEVESFKDIFQVGTLCRVMNVKSSGKSPKYNVQALDKVNLFSFEKIDGMFYSNAEIRKDNEENAKEEIVLMKTFIGLLQDNGLTTLFTTKLNDFYSLLKNATDTTSFINFCGHNLNIAYTEKQAVLEGNNNREAIEALIEILELRNKENKYRRTINRKVKESSEKQQKEYFLREQMRAIRKELGEESENAPQELIDRLIKENYPKEVIDKVKEETKRITNMPAGSLEASLIQDYIDNLVALPWVIETEDNNDLKHVREILDADHYGLTKAKERILEYLAVKKMNGNLKAPIICFYGAPGTGKTSLSKSVARALNRNFVKCALGGITDEAEIRGHRRTYVASRPGRIINLLKKVKSKNPVFLLDEIDKLASSNKGDPTSALLEVLDPEQNNAFNDNYLELSYDLSKVLFICTANDLGNIPEPLRDRLELIEVDSYTTFDKLHIAQEHLIRKQIGANGLDKYEVSFNNDAIEYIIDHYTRESGVRELERKIATILRKLIVTYFSLSDDNKVKIVDIDVVKELLGTEIFDSTNKEKESQIGVVTGLAYTQYGGDILPIEVNYFKGSGKFILTGKLGDVMKESCSIALDYVKANAERYGIDSELFDKNDIHIHVPEGAVPKDGPSAGVAITTAIISAFTKKPINSDIAMTGEVTLRGNALAIGGLKEKSLAALRSGIKTIIVPFDNKKNVNELPNEVKDNLKIVYMKNVDDALKELLG